MCFSNFKGRRTAMIPLLMLWLLCILAALAVVWAIAALFQKSFEPSEKSPVLTSFSVDGKDDPVLAAMFGQRSRRLLKPNSDWKASFAQPAFSDLLSLDLTQRTDETLQAPISAT